MPSGHGRSRVLWQVGSHVPRWSSQGKGQRCTGHCTKQDKRKACRPTSHGCWASKKTGAEAETAAATIVFRSSRIIHWPKLHLVKRRLGSNSTPTRFSDGTFPENLCFYTDRCFQIPILPPTFTLVSSPPAPSIFRLAESWITRLQPPQLPSFTISFHHQIWLSYIFFTIPQLAQLYYTLSWSKWPWSQFYPHDSHKHIPSGIFSQFAIENGHRNSWFTIWLFNIAMENGPFIDDFPIKTSIYKGFSMAMLNNNQRVPIKNDGFPRPTAPLKLARWTPGERECPLWQNLHGLQRKWCWTFTLVCIYIIFNIYIYNYYIYIPYIIYHIYDYQISDIR